MKKVLIVPKGMGNIEVREGQVAAPVIKAVYDWMDLTPETTMEIRCDMAQAIVEALVAKKEKLLAIKFIKSYINLDSFGLLQAKEFVEDIAAGDKPHDYGSGFSYPSRD